ncbi:MAG: hypothetical protein HY767_01805, partial [Candidatus Omnitrophica bacterium]|nr:hypothetical protein [Candidatus Omnitrophota bacterium]
MRRAISFLCASMVLYFILNAGCARPETGWDEFLEKAHDMLIDKEVRAKFTMPDKAGMLDAECAILRFDRHPKESLEEARNLTEPFFSSLAIGGIAAKTLDMSQSEKLYIEALNRALKIDHWTGSDASSLGYLFQMIPQYKPKQADRLLEISWNILDSWKESDNQKSHAMRVLSMKVIEIEPESAKEILLNKALKGDYYEDSIELLA